MNVTQTAALAHFEAFYPAFARALDEEDAELVAELVEEREHALEKLLQAFAGTLLPADVRAHVEGTEAMMHTRLLRFYDQVIVRLAEERRRSWASERYQENTR